MERYMILKNMILKIVRVAILMIKRQLKILILQIFIRQKIIKNILIYDISYKPFIGSKPLRIRFDEIDGFIKTYGGIEL